MATYKFISGKPRMVPYTPGGAVAAGDLVIFGGCCRIAHNPIASGTLDALAAEGAVYEGPKATGGSSGWADGVKLYANNSTGALQVSNSSATPFGFAVGAAADGSAVARAILSPF